MKPRFIVFEFALTALSILIAVITGIDLIGKPLRLVSLLTLLGLGMAAGALLVQAILHLRQERSRKSGPRD